jgi:general secretion pathway protein M
MNDYFNSLNEREKTMLMFAAACLLLYLYFVLLYAPITHRVRTEKNLLVEKIQTLEWMKKIHSQGLTSNTKKTINNNQLLTLIASELKVKQSFNPYQLQQLGLGDVELSFEAVPFNLFLSWLIELNKGYQLKFKQLNAKPTQTPGVTQLTLVLSAE